MAESCFFVLSWVDVYAECCQNLITWYRLKKPEMLIDEIFSGLWTVSFQLFASSLVCVVIIPNCLQNAEISVASQFVNICLHLLFQGVNWDPGSCRGNKSVPKAPAIVMNKHRHLNMSRGSYHVQLSMWRCFIVQVPCPQFDTLTSLIRRKEVARCSVTAEHYNHKCPYSRRSKALLFLLPVGGTRSHNTYVRQVLFEKTKSIPPLS